MLNNNSTYDEFSIYIKSKDNLILTSKEIITASKYNKKTIDFEKENLGISFSNIPDWLLFYLWSGYWIIRNQNSEYRLILTLLLPSNRLCSQLVTLGTLIGSLDESLKNLNWQDILNLQQGTQITFYAPNSKTGDRNIPLMVNLWKLKRERDGSHSRRIKITSNRKNFENASLYIVKKNCVNYQVKLADEKDQHKKRIIPQGSFFKNFTSDFKYSWFNNNIIECLLITNKVNWISDSNEIFIVDTYIENKIKRHSLNSLLFTKNKDIMSEIKVLLSSPRSKTEFNVTPPVTILDGSEALKMFEMIDSNNVIIIVDQNELDETDLDLLANISNVRLEQKAYFLEDFPKNLPNGMEISLYVLSRNC